MAVNAGDVSAALHLAGRAATDVLRALGGSGAGEDALALCALADEGQREVDALRRRGTLGLTVQLNELVVLDTHEGPLSGSGEFYLVAWFITGGGRLVHATSPVFRAVGKGEALPLGEGGMLLGALTDPRWFLDVHVVVMESDRGLPELERLIDDVRARAGEAVGRADRAAHRFDPTVLLDVRRLLAGVAEEVARTLVANGDDHVATIHDFYLEQQAFGAGVHPRPGTSPASRLRFQGVEARYTIALSVTS